jgi:cysteine-rich repeat protein
VVWEPKTWGKTARKQLRSVLVAVVLTPWTLNCSLVAEGLDGSASSHLGSVELNLVLPSGEDAASIELHLVCSNLDQQHTLDVSEGDVVAMFGGIAPGACHAEASASTLEGLDCIGEEEFTVVADQLSSVTLVLYCQGRDETPSGSALFNIDFDFFDCSTDRIASIQADPSTLHVGESVTVLLEPYPGSVVGMANVAFALHPDSEHAGEATLSAPATCSSFGCIEVNCTGTGEHPVVDPVSNLPSATVAVVATLEDRECFDGEVIQITCLADSVCGDALVSAGEECDDGNTSNGDGCSSQCAHEYCDGGAVFDGGVVACTGDGGMGDAGLP